MAARVTAPVGSLRMASSFPAGPSRKVLPVRSVIGSSPVIHRNCITGQVGSGFASTDSPMFVSRFDLRNTNGGQVSEPFALRYTDRVSNQPMFKPKTNHHLQICCVVLAALLLVTAAYPQSGRKTTSSKQAGQDEPLRLRAEEVLLNVTVADPYGHQATDLVKDEFIIAEDGQRQDIASFVLSSVPVNVVLLLDASGSIVSEISSLRDAAMHFV